jgi:hypothetical protein
MVVSLAPRGSETLLGQDLSFRDWVKQTRAANSNNSASTSLTPVFSGGFERQGIYRVFITYPIIDRVTKEYQGMVGGTNRCFFFTLWKHRANKHTISCGP